MISPQMALTKKYYVMCGSHYQSITLGFGCAWATSADRDHATLFNSEADAVMSAKLAKLSDYEIHERDILNVTRNS